MRVSDFWIVMRETVTGYEYLTKTMIWVTSRYSAGVFRRNEAEMYAVKFGGFTMGD